MKAPWAIVILLLVPACRGPSVEIPQPDLAGAEPEVAEAIDEARRHLSGHDRAAEAWGRYADRLRAHGFDTEAAASYVQAAELDPERFDWHYLAALSLMPTDLEGAVVQLEQALAVDPRYVPARVHHGRALMDLGRFDEARTSFAQAIAVEPTPQAYLGLGHLALGDGDLDQAREQFGLALGLRPRFRPARLGLSQVLLASGEQEKARSHAQRAGRSPAKTPLPDPRSRRLVEPVGSQAHNDRGIELNRAGEAEQAEAHFREALRIRPDFAEAHYNLGTILARTGRLDEAIEQLTAAVEQGPANPDVRVNLALALGQSGRLDEARVQLDEALEDDPSHVKARRMRAALRRQQGDIGGAIDDYREALKAEPGAIDSAWQLAWILATAGSAEHRDGEEAIRWAEQACRLSAQREPRALDALAAAYAEAGRPLDALQAARTARQLAGAQGQSQLAGAINERLLVYGRGEPWREPPLP